MAYIHPHTGKLEQAICRPPVFYGKDNVRAI
jgi:hypothetical protein